MLWDTFGPLWFVQVSCQAPWVCSCAMEPQQLPDHSVCAASFGGQKALSPFGGRLTFGGIPDQMSISMGYLIGSVRATNWVSKNCMAHVTRGNTDVCFVFVLKHPIWGYAKKAIDHPSGFAARSFSGHVSGPAKDLRVQAFLYRERTGFVMRVAQGMDAL